jgi:hypothetical protein
MPNKKSKSVSRKNRRTKRPNVFTQSQPIEHGETETQVAVTTASTENTPRAKAHVDRTTRRAGARSEIYTRSLPAELRKIGVLTAFIAVTLTVLSFVL